jgi:phosphoribosyl-ATP pyrophosphohydrolase
MKKVIKLTEEDLAKIIKKILKEEDDEYYDLEDYKKADEYASDLISEIDDAINYNILFCHGLGVKLL